MIHFIVAYFHLQEPIFLSPKSLLVTQFAWSQREGYSLATDLESNHLLNLQTLRLLLSVIVPAE